MGSYGTSGGIPVPNNDHFRGHKKLRSAFQEDEDFPFKAFGHPILVEKATLILFDYLMVNTYCFPCYVMVSKQKNGKNGTKTRIHRKTSHFLDGEHDLNASLQTWFCDSCATPVTSCDLR